MLEDSTVSPGCKAYWDEFYDEGGVLGEKDRRIRRRHKPSADEDPNTTLSVLNHYEWFTTFDVYGGVLEAMLNRWRQDSLSTSAQPSGLRCLHVGCGNSDFADHVNSMSPPKGSATHSRRKRPHAPPGEVEVLNVDICESLIGRLAKVFPSRRYAVADCCDMVAHTGSELHVRQGWHAEEGGKCRILPNAVDVIFDKGTIDAMLSAFPGEVNPNAQMYANNCLSVLHHGGLMVLLSINSESTLMPYFITAEDAANPSKYFKLLETLVMDVTSQFDDADDPSEAAQRVETLGVRYTMYGFLCSA